MVVIAHAGHWTLGLLEATPLLVVVAFALWKSRAERANGTREPHDVRRRLRRAIGAARLMP
jgi:hypothetical protein